MEKMKVILNEIHLYPSKLEMFIKVGIWIISWLGGIVAIQGVPSKDGLASAYFLFALSLLMEFAGKIRGKKELISKIVHTIFCFLIASVLLIAIAILFGTDLSEEWYSLLFILTLIIIICMIVDCFILWLSKEAEPQTKRELSDAHKENQVIVFEQKLTNGNLGSLEKEVSKNV